MSTTQTSPADHTRYARCSFCNIMLAVTVPGGHILCSNAVNVRCGHCANLLSLHLGSSLPPLPLRNHHLQLQKQLQASQNASFSTSHGRHKELGSSLPLHNDRERLLPIRPSGKRRRRVPSAYNRFIKEEIQRLKAYNPSISHKQAFSTAAKNWARLPHIHIGLNLDNYKQKGKLKA